MFSHCCTMILDMLTTPVTTDSGEHRDDNGPLYSTVRQIGGSKMARSLN